MLQAERLSGASEEVKDIWNEGGRWWTMSELQTQMRAPRGHAYSALAESSSRLEHSGRLKYEYM